jgi:hypothetical protein
MMKGGKDAKVSSSSSNSSSSGSESRSSSSGKDSSSGSDDKESESNSSSSEEAGERAQKGVRPGQKINGRTVEESREDIEAQLEQVMINDKRK